MSTAIMPRASVHEIVALRDESIRLFEEGYKILKKARLLAKQAASMSYLESIPARAVHMIEHGSEDQAGDFAGVMTKVVDRAVWKHILLSTGLEKLMDAQAHKEFNHQLETDPPEVTADTCFATLEQFAGDADMIFRRGVANAFSRLDRRFRSHDGFRIGSKMIFDRAFSEYGSWSGYGCDTRLRDVERAFYVLDGKKQPERYAGIIGAIDEERKNFGLSPGRFTAESEYFRVRSFANGNLHVYFTRDDLVKEVNLLLAEYYGASLGAAPDVAEKKHKTKTGIAKNFGFFPTPARLADDIIERAYLKPGMTVLEPNAGTGSLSTRALDLGCDVTCIEYQPQLALQLEEETRYSSVLCMDFLETEPSLIGTYERIVMNPPFDGGRDVDHVNHAIDFLADGGLLIAIMSAGTEFRSDAKTKDFRARVDALGGDFHDLPPGSFADSGTMVNTVVLTLRKRSIQH